MGCAACGQKYRKRNGLRFQRVSARPSAVQTNVPVAPGAASEIVETQERVPGASVEEVKGESDVPTES